MAGIDIWQKVRSALGNPNWDFRSIEGIAKETELDPREVREAILHNMSEVRQARSRDGNIIYTLESRPVRPREVMAVVGHLRKELYKGCAGVGEKLGRSYGWNGPQIGK